MVEKQEAEKKPIVIICGTLGVGKSTMAARIAQNTGFRFKSSNGVKGCT
jgi:deoxyadenosine/deoxycytidine kinase